MNRMKNIALRAQNGFMMRLAGVKGIKPKMEKGDHLLEVLGTIIIAVVILLLFKEQIVKLFTDALSKTTTSVNGMFGSVSDT